MSDAPRRQIREDDDDLDELYHKVLEGFSTPSSLLSPVSDEHGPKPDGCPDSGNGPGISPHLESPALFQDNPNYHIPQPQPPVPAPPRSAPQPRAVRPLPPTPDTILRPKSISHTFNLSYNQNQLATLSKSSSSRVSYPHPPIQDNRPFSTRDNFHNHDQLDRYVVQPHVPQMLFENNIGPSESPHREPLPMVPGYERNVEDDPHAYATLIISPTDQNSYGQPYENFYAEGDRAMHPTDGNPRSVQPIMMTPNEPVITGGSEVLRSPSDTSELSYGSPHFSQSVPIPNGSADIIDISVSNVYTDADGWNHTNEPRRRNTIVMQDITNFNSSSLRDEIIVDESDDDEWLEEEYDRQFVNLSMLSNLAVLLRDKVPRGTHVKGSIPYPRAFTGKDIVSTIHAQIQRELVQDHNGSLDDRRAALHIARSLQSQLYFYEVEWGGRILQDGVEDVYMFLDDQEDGSVSRQELPTGVVTFMTKCYTPLCQEGSPCFAYSCPRRGLKQLSNMSEIMPNVVREDWINAVPVEVLQTLPESEISRQTIIHKLISKEEQYIRDLNIVESVFIKPLRHAKPPVVSSLILDEFVEEVFGNILAVRECNKRLLEVLYVRQREQSPVIRSIGDVLLDAATEFRRVYPAYVGHHSLADKRIRLEMEHNAEFRLFIERCSRKQAVRHSDTPRLDLRHFLNRPIEHLQKYPLLLEAIYTETATGNPDGDYLLEAIDAIKNLQLVAQLRTFQSAMGKGITAKWEWHDLISADTRRALTKEESKRQAIIFELIKGEMAYVKDLENIKHMYIRPLRDANPPIIDTNKIDDFIQDVFHNYTELYSHHRRLVEKFHEIQREEHPRIRSITAAVYDAALNFREAYMEYIPNYPIAAYRIDEQIANNPGFRRFVDQKMKHPEAHQFDMKSFINRPIPRLLCYHKLLKGILDETPINHEDRTTIPHVIDLIKTIGRETEPGVTSAKQKVELWRYNSNLIFKHGEAIDMDLLNEQRSLIHTGKLLRQSNGVTEHNGWSELFVLLFDNYMVMTKPRERDGVVGYQVTRRPIPLDLLTLRNVTDPPIARSTGQRRTPRGSDRQSDTSSSAARNSRSSESGDSRSLYPISIHHNGRLGGPYVLFAESAQIRLEWKQKLEEALGLRKVVQESNKVFEIETLSIGSFLVPFTPATSTTTWHDGTIFTGKVTCSVPFTTPDGRGLIAIGCPEGVWIGYRRDSRSIKRVLHIRLVTQCAMLEDFGIFLVLADKSLFAYHIETLVQSPQSFHATQAPHKLNKSREEVQFFSVGTLNGRTLVIYMKKKGTESVFHALEPVIDKINERPKASSGLFPRIGRSRSSRSEWFKHYGSSFSLSTDAYDVIFLKAKIAILCTKGFEIMDLTDYNSTTIPHREDARLKHFSKRCETCRPLGMYRTSDEEFLLCYTEFGIYVNKNGGLSRDAGIVEWEGTADRVAFHSPYILLFDPRFIEIRNVKTGRLAQIFIGADIHCAWDGRGVDDTAAITVAKQSDGHMDQEPRVHAVMNMTEPVLLNSRPSRGVVQHVFELIPTIPLYLPGSLASPSSPSYFPQTFSPPHSPRMRPSTSYR